MTLAHRPVPRPRNRLALVAVLVLGIGAVPASGVDAGTTRTPTAAPRLLHGPQVYRLRPTGARYGDIGDSSYRYAIVFVLSRVVIGPTFEGDDEGDVKAGEFSLGGAYLSDYTHDRLYAEGRGSQRCVVAYYDPDDSETLASDTRRLDRLRIGQRVSVTLRPLASANPDVSYGRTYHRRATLRQGGRYRLTEAGVQRRLRAIGCQRR